MKKLSQFTPLFTAFIAFIALIGGFSFAVDLAIRPIKIELTEIKANQARFERDVTLKLDKILDVRDLKGKRSTAVAF